MKKILLIPIVFLAGCVGPTPQPFRVGPFEAASKLDFVANGRCATRNQSPADQAAVRQTVSRFLQRKGRAREATFGIPIHFHVVTKSDGSGGTTKAALTEQVKEINDSYKPYGFSFTWDGNFDTRADDALYATEFDSPEETRLKKVGKDQESSLNIYVAGAIRTPRGGVLGWATFPSDLSKAKGSDGIVILTSSLPGNPGPFGLGKTAVHEIGHWIGLYHTFQDGCSQTNDDVDDTPPIELPTFGTCEENKDKLACPPTDPRKPREKADISNYMDYTDDACMDHFTPGQNQRAKAQMASFRPKIANLTP